MNNFLKRAYYTGDFDFVHFNQFIHDLMGTYGFWDIRFFTDRDDLFSDFQLTHAAPLGNPNHKDGFIWAWRINKKEVPRVAFVFKDAKRTKNIRMSVNLDSKEIGLEKVTGISTAQVWELVQSNFCLNKARKKYPWRWVIPINPLLQHPTISTVIGGLIVAFFVYYFGWNK